MKLSGKNYKLSSRKASDVLALTKFTKELNLPEDISDPSKLDTDQVTGFVTIMATTICHSLKATYLNKNHWWEALSRRKYKIFLDESTGVDFIISNLDPQEMNDIYGSIIGLDEIKKKVVQGKGLKLPIELEKN